MSAIFQPILSFFSGLADLLFWAVTIVVATSVGYVLIRAYLSLRGAVRHHQLVERLTALELTEKLRDHNQVLTTMTTTTEKEHARSEEDSKI